MEKSDSARKRASKLPLVIGMLLAIGGGGGAFYAVHSGMIKLTGGEASGSATAAKVVGPEPSPLPDVEFVPLEPLLVSLNASEPAQQLRFEGELEVRAGEAANVRKLMPRIMDVMNGYLRAVEVGDLREPAALFRIRAQMLRRIQTVTGEGRVRDLLVKTFLIS